MFFLKKVLLFVIMFLLILTGFYIQNDSPGVIVFENPIGINENQLFTENLYGDSYVDGSIVIVKLKSDISSFYNYDELSRDDVLNYYSLLRFEFHEDISDLNYNFSIDIGSPYIFLYENDAIAEENIPASILRLSSGDKVEYISISDFVNRDLLLIDPECIMLGCGGGTTTDPQYDIDQVISTINATNVNYTGDGIKIGIIDGGRINYATMPYSSIENYPQSGVLYNDHSTKVAKVILEIAPDAEIFGAYFTSVDDYLDSTYFDGLQWLLTTKNVDVINMSFGYEYLVSLNENTLTDFNALTNYFNDLIRDNKITIVAAAGNEVETDTYLRTPGIVSNIITVGATTTAGTQLASYSSYTEIPGHPNSKPNIVAPGNMNVFDDYVEGTSFAAPVVTGAIALAMEAESGLKNDPQSIMSAIMVSTNTSLFGNHFYDYNLDRVNDVYGSGLLDVSNFISIITQTNYSESKYIYDLNLDRNIYITASTSSPKNLRVCLAWLSIVDNGATDFTNYDIKVYYNGQILDDSILQSNNFEIIDIIVNQTGYYYIDIINNDGNSSFYEFGTLSWKVE